MNLLLSSLLIPAVSALIVFLLPKKWMFRELFTVAIAILNLVIALSLFGKDLSLTFPWGGGWGFAFDLKVNSFNSFVLTASAGFGVLISLYSMYFMEGKAKLSQFYAYVLLTLAQVNGVLLSDNLILMLFFWEGLLLTLFGFIIIGGEHSFSTAVKAFIINGLADLCMVAGIGLTGYLAGTYSMSSISLPVGGLASLAFVLLMIGAIAKAGAMPFHSWIPNAAIDAPLPFMAFIPASLEKLVGIYFLSKICLNLFKLDPSSWLSTLLMIIGAVTILLAVMMALIQKDFKKLLSYHAISQVGYMILGIGTAVPAGIIGGIFHMINNAMYKEGLFLSGGCVEKQAGTTDLNRLGGLASKMPITFICFLITAVSISGVPPFNGFFSKELVYDGALERNWIFYAAALLGSFLTAASFLKLGHSAFFGKLARDKENVKEAHWTMLTPMLVLAGFCIFFGIYNVYPIEHLIRPVLGNIPGEHHFSGMPSNMFLIVMTLVVLLVAFLNHRYGFKKSGSGLGAADHIHHAPVLNYLYNKAEAGFFDPYNWVVKIVYWCSLGAFRVDRANDWIFNKLSVKTAKGVSSGISKCHTGNFSLYVVWSFVGLIALIVWFVRSVG
jgi:NADH-quinone oxidoreductase subunit L